MISFIDVQKRYYYKGSCYNVFDDLNFTLDTNVKYGILGKNGDGKTTLINMIANLERPNKGKIAINCKVSWPIGFSNIQTSLTSDDNVRFVSKIHGLNQQQTKNIIDYVYNFAEIGDYFFKPFKSYSSGMRARINFGLSMAFSDYFDFYLIDEATAAGDIFFVKKAKEEFQNRLKGKGCILVSHNSSEIQKLCEKFGVIVNKKIEFYDEFDIAYKRYKEYNESRGNKDKNIS